jgi:uncharacterized RDD family membrane protein YckC
VGELAGLGQRVGSFLIDFVLQAIPLIGLIASIISWVMFQRGSTIGLTLVSARLVRDNGDVSGFFHTTVRAFAAVLSIIPLGLGYFWAFWDPMRQTWHDKIMNTYVLKDTPELKSRRGSSSTGAVITFWALLALSLIIWIGLILLIAMLPETDNF